jgi:hypothetical protein
MSLPQKYALRLAIHTKILLDVAAKTQLATRDFKHHAGTVFPVPRTGDRAPLSSTLAIP